MPCEERSFTKKLKTMLKVDFKRMFTMPLIYIMAGISLVIPILILIMTSMTAGTVTVDPATGVEKTAEAFDNVWQTIGSVSGGDTATSMDITAMCNINLIYFLIAVFVCIFVAEDFKSGYAKNLFTVRAKRTDYCVSKTAAGFAGGAIMIIAYIIGATVGGLIAGLSFDTGTAGAAGIVACLFSKIFLVAVFASVAFLAGVVGKQKLWLSIVCSLAVCMLLYTMIPMISPLDAGFMNVVMCLVGGALFSAGFGAIGNVVLNKTSLV